MKPLYLPFILIFLMFKPAEASVIQYQLTPLGGDHYRYDYTVNNDGSVGPDVKIEGFSIQFDQNLYAEESLSILSPEPLAWLGFILSSGLLVPAAYDTSALLNEYGVAPGDSLSGFAVEFNWLGAGLPGAQAFEIYDPNSLDVISSGLTTLVPLPGALYLFLPSLTLVWSMGRHKMRS